MCRRFPVDSVDRLDAQIDRSPSEPRPTTSADLDLHGGAEREAGLDEELTITRNMRGDIEQDPRRRVTRNRLSSSMLRHSLRSSAVAGNAVVPLQPLLERGDKTGDESVGQRAVHRKQRSKLGTRNARA